MREKRDNERSGLRSNDRFRARLSSRRQTGRELYRRSGESDRTVRGTALGRRLNRFVFINPYLFMKTSCLAIIIGHDLIEIVYFHMFLLSNLRPVFYAIL